MQALEERFVVDSRGEKIGVLLEMERYVRLLEAEEELEAIRAFDAVKASGDEVIPFKQAVAEIEQARA